MERRKPIIGVDFITFKIIKFTDINSAETAGYFPNNVLCGRGKYANGMMWYYDIGQTDKELIERTKSLNITTKGKHSWLICDKNKRIQSMRENSKKKPIVAVSITTKEVIFYESIHAAKRAGFAISSIYACLNGEAKTGQKYVWFYKTIDSIDEYIKMAKDILQKSDKMP